MAASLRSFPERQRYYFRDCRSSWRRSINEVGVVVHLAGGVDVISLKMFQSCSLERLLIQAGFTHAGLSFKQVPREPCNDAPIPNATVWLAGFQDSGVGRRVDHTRPLTFKKTRIYLSFNKDDYNTIQDLCRTLIAEIY